MTKQELRSLIEDCVATEIEKCSTSVVEEVSEEDINDNAYLEQCLLEESIMFEEMEDIFAEAAEDDILEESHGSRQRKARAEGKATGISRQEWNKNSDYVKSAIKAENKEVKQERLNNAKEFTKRMKKEYNMSKDDADKIIKNRKQRIKKDEAKAYSFYQKDLYSGEEKLNAAKAEKESTINAVADKLVSKSTSSSSEDKKELMVITQAKAKEEAADSIAKKLGKGFKATGGKIVSIYSGKEGRGKQVAAIAVAASALAASVGAAAYIKAKKKAKEAESKEKKK